MSLRTWGRDIPSSTAASVGATSAVREATTTPVLLTGPGQQLSRRLYPLAGSNRLGLGGTSNAGSRPDGLALGRIRHHDERRAVLLVAGDKAGQWSAWYEREIPLAEARYALDLKERDA